MEITADMVNTDDINLDWLAKNMPDLVDEIKKQAIDEEHNRQKDVDQSQQNSEDKSEPAKALFEEARYDISMTAGDVLVKLAALQAEAKKRLSEERHTDAEKIPAVKSSGADDNVNDKLIISAMKAGITGGRVQ